MIELQLFYSVTKIIIEGRVSIDLVPKLQATSAQLLRYVCVNSTNNLSDQVLRTGSIVVNNVLHPVAAVDLFDS